MKLLDIVHPADIAKSQDAEIRDDTKSVVLLVKILNIDFYFFLLVGEILEQVKKPFIKEGVHSGTISKVCCQPIKISVDLIHQIS